MNVLYNGKTHKCRLFVGSLSMPADNYSHSGGAGAVLVMSLSVKAAPLVRTNRFAPPRSVVFIEAVQIP